MSESIAMIDNVAVRCVAINEAIERVDALTDSLADLLIDCVEGGASVGFMVPIARTTALAFWRGITGAVARGDRTLLVAEDADGRILGTVQLVTAQPENQPHRADVAKMLVHRRARRQGIGQRLMAAVEDVARREGKQVLVLDTETGGDAERLYQRAGWRRVGTVPNYALMPTGELCDTTFYSKQIDSA